MAGAQVTFEMLKSLTPESGTVSIPAATLVEWIASKSSSSVYVYDLAEHAGLGKQTKEWSRLREGVSKFVGLQTRAGAGVNIVGRLSAEGTSEDVKDDSLITAYNTPNGLALMAHSLEYLPPVTQNRRLVIHVPTVTPIGDSLELSPTLAPLAPILPTIPDSFSVFLSATPQEIVDFAALSYSLSSSHVIHLFDQYSAAREVGQATYDPISLTKSYESVREAFDKAGYAFFDYCGDQVASEVLVLLNGPLAITAKKLIKQGSGLGLVIVRVLRPWDSAAFVDALPKTARSVHVLDEVPAEGTSGNLYLDVLSAALESGRSKLNVHSIRAVPARTQAYLKSPDAFATFLRKLAPTQQVGSIGASDNEANVRNLLFAGTTTSPLSLFPVHILKFFPPSTTVKARLLTDRDLFSKPGGVSVTRMTLTSNAYNDYVPLPVLIPFDVDTDAKDGAAHFLGVLDHSLLKTHSFLRQMRTGGVLLVLTSWTGAEFLSNLPPASLAVLRDRNIRVYKVDPTATAEGATEANKDELATVVGHLAFLKLYLGQFADESLLKKLARSAYGNNLDGQKVDKLAARAWSALEEVDVTEYAPGEEFADETAIPLKGFEFNSIDVDFGDDGTGLPGAHISKWHTAAKHILFPDAYAPPDLEPVPDDAYPQNPALRPEVPDRTYLVSCSVNCRLTPLDYDRNVFHLEFDTRGTGLRYAIGEALGVHGWNEDEDVLDFCRWYGVDHECVVTIPVPNSEGRLHTRTVFQALQQQIDIFGHPPKSFYAALSEYATRQQDKLALQFIGSPEGSATYKKLSEKDTVTFADVLRQYPSAKPPVQVLCELIGDIKPRHYSIASAQSVVGDRVDLLVVTVEWTTPTGSPRYGQCTRYLANLKVGQKVTVSIKPSVMKLPPDNLQPLILAGLGTGAAPFRAFLQHRALLAAEGIAVGPLFYYFGSRYRGKEYLYGEEIEAFILDRTITKAGLAFSRDGRKKVYIQHKMVEDAETLVRMLHTDKGVFYLCGPTWPVPDVYETLVAALQKHIGLGEKEAGDYLEGLKEEERYVLEVY